MATMEERQIMQDHWDTVQQWRIDEGVNYEREMSRTKARLGAGGVKTGSDSYNAQISKIESDYEAAKESIGGGATQGILDRYATTTKQNYLTGAAPTKMKQTKETEVVDLNIVDAMLQSQGIENWYKDLEISSTTFNALTTEEFLAQEFGYSDAYTEYFGEQEGLGLTARTTSLTPPKKASQADKGGGGRK